MVEDLARRAPAARSLPAGHDDRRRQGPEAGLDIEPLTEKPRRGASSRPWRGREPLRLPGCGEASCAGKASAAPAAPGTPSSRRSSAGTPRGRSRLAHVAAPAATAPVRPGRHGSRRPRLPTRHRRGRPRPRRRLVPGSLVLLGGEPGIGKSTLVLEAAAGARRRGARPLRVGRGIGGAAPPARRPAGPARRPGRGPHRGPRRDDVERIVDGGQAMRRRSLVVDSIQTPTIDELEAPAGSVGQVREAAAPAHGVREGRGDRGRARRPRDQGRLARRTEDPGAPRRRRARARGRTLRGAAPGARAKNRFGSTEEVGVFEMAGERPARGPRPGARIPRATTPSRRAGRRRRADAGGQPAAARRGPGAGGAGRASARRARTASGHRPEPPGAAGRGARPAGRHRPGAPRRLREPRRRR